MRKRRTVTRIARDEARKLAIPSARVSEVEFSSSFEQYLCRMWQQFSSDGFLTLHGDFLTAQILRSGAAVDALLR
jgi:hypothetical protein